MLVFVDESGNTGMRLDRPGASDGLRFRPTKAVPSATTVRAIFTLWMPDEPMILS